MNHNIDLGTFSWDTTKLQDQLAANTRETMRFANIIKEGKKEIAEFSKQINETSAKIESENKAQQRLNDQLQKGFISQAQYNSEIASSNRRIEELITEEAALAKQQADRIIKVNELQQKTKQLNAENAQLNTLLNAGRTEISGNESAYRNLNKELNALKLEAKDLGAQMVILEEAGRKDSQEYKELAARFAETSKKADELNDKFKNIDKSIGDNQRSVGDYKDQIKSALGEVIVGVQEIASGDVISGFDKVKTGIGGIEVNIKSLFTYLKANPWILIVGAIAGYVKEMVEYNIQTKELNKEVEQIANTSGSVTDELRKSAAALQETYGGDFKDRVRELNSLMTDFGISANEAFSIYNQGLAQGGALNSEFADSIREYGPLFAQNGYSAQEFINILNAGIDLDIYSDKLPDAIKEAGLSLKEQTKATRDALVNAFGASFTDDILQRIQSGKTTVADGLNEIAAKSKEMHLNEQQLAQLTADVFKGAGEDAGGAVKIFEALNRAQNANADSLTEIQKQTIELTNLNYELETAKENAFKSDTVMAFGQDVKNIWKQIQIAWYNALDDITGFLQGAINGWRLGFLNTRDFIAMIPQAFRSVISGMKADFQNFGEIARTFGAIIKSAFTFDIAGVEANFNSLMAKVRAFQSQTKVEISKVGAQLGTGGTINQKNIALINAKDRTNAKLAQQEPLSSGSGRVTGSVADAAAKTDANAKKSADAKVREAERAKREQDRLMQEQAAAEIKRLQDLAQEKIDIAKNDLASYIATNAAKLEDHKRINAEILNEEKKKNDELLAKKQAVLDAEREKELAAANLSEQDKINIRNEYAAKQLELENENKAANADLDKKYYNQSLEDQKLSDAIAFQQKIIDLEANHASEFEIRQAQADHERQVNLQKNQEDYNNGLISKENYEANIVLIESKHAAESKAIRKAVTDAQIDGFGQVFGMAKQVFGEQTAVGKAAAIAETTINTYRAAQNAWTSLSGIPIVGPALGAAAAGLAVAAGLANVRKIMSVQTPKAARGMLISGPSHAGGGVQISTPNGIIEAEGGEPILTKKAFKMFPQLISDINVAGGGIPLFARGGIAGVSPAYLPSVRNSIESGGINMENMTVAIAVAVAEGAAAGTHAGSQSGISELSVNKRIAEGANF